MKVYRVVWSDYGPDQLDPESRRYRRVKIYTSVSSAKAEITYRLNHYGYRNPTMSGAILESEINWTPWAGN